MGACSSKAGPANVTASEPKAQAKAVPAAPAEEKPAAAEASNGNHAPAPPAAAEPEAAAAPPPAPEAPAPKAEEELKVPMVDGSLPSDSVVIFVLGGPGSGKGTQCDLIKERYKGVVHLSAGDLLRAEVNSGSAIGGKLNAIMKEGKLVPMTVTIALLKNAMISSGGSFFLVDGFPRALDQAEEFERSIMECKSVLFFDCPEEEMEKRIAFRGQTSGRADDNPETMRKRFHTFITESLPVKDYYLGKGKCNVVSAVATKEEVFEEVKKVLDPISPIPPSE